MTAMCAVQLYMVPHHGSNDVDGPCACIVDVPQIQQAHSFLSELELKPTASKVTEPKSKKRSLQNLSRTEHDFEQLGAIGVSEIQARGSADGCAAAVDFSDVSLDWGLGKLVRTLS